MLNPDEAKKRLAAEKNPDGGKQRDRAVFALPSHLRAVAFGFLERNADGSVPKRESDYYYSSDSKLLLNAVHTAEKLSQTDLSRVFLALLPGMEDVTYLAWRMGFRLPYLDHYTRRAFRAPNAPLTTSGIRARFLRTILEAMKGYEHKDVLWLANWAPYLSSYGVPNQVGYVLAAAIDARGARGQEVLQTLIDTTTGQADEAAMGRHVTTGLLTCSTPAGWEAIEKLLLAAQRQEGVRQVILETVDLAHPVAFRRMLDLIESENLIRFSSVIRAAGVWFGFGLEVEHAKQVRGMLARTSTLLRDESERDKAIYRGSGEDCYLGLWCLAFFDAVTACEAATQIMKHDDPERRLAAAYILSQIQLVSCQPPLINGMADPDKRVAACAFSGLSEIDTVTYPHAFDSVSSLLTRCGKNAQNFSVEWAPGIVFKLAPQQVADSLLTHLGTRNPSALIPYMKQFSPYGRARAIEKLVDNKPAVTGVSTATDLGSTFSRLLEAGKQLLAGATSSNTQSVPDTSSSATRELLFEYLGDPSQTVRHAVFKGLSKFKVRPEEVPAVEALLTRKASDLRTGVLALLEKQSDASALDSAERLINAGNKEQRSAGVELLQLLIENKRMAGPCRALLAEVEKKDGLTVAEQATVRAATADDANRPTLDNLLGLATPTKSIIAPRKIPNVQLVTNATIPLIASLDALIHEHRQVEIKGEGYGSDVEKAILGETTWAFPSPKSSLTRDDDLARLPIREHIEAWNDQRAPATRDADGFEVLRAMVVMLTATGQSHYWDTSKRWKVYASRGVDHSLDHGFLVQKVLPWLLRINPPANAVDFVLDALETTMSATSGSGWLKLIEDRGWLPTVRLIREFYPDQWAPHHHIRFFQLLRWIDERAVSGSRVRPRIEELLAAIEHGGANEADLIDQLIGPRSKAQYSHSRDFSDLRTHSGLKPSNLEKQYPLLTATVQKCRARLLEIELQRGDRDTAATEPSTNLRFTGHSDIAIQAMVALDSSSLARTGASYYYYDSAAASNRAYSLSRIIRSTRPSPDDTKERFAEELAKTKLKQKRLLEVAVFAPQWAGHIEAAIGWPGLEEGVWWLHSHTKDEGWSVDRELKEEWGAVCSSRTPLESSRLLDGAVDVDWFHRIYQTLGEERWKSLSALAKFASSGVGHTRAQLYADTMTGKMTVDQLITSVETKRKQDSVRALGLAPLSNTDDPEAEVLSRYKILQEFLRTSKQFGQMRQTTEKLAVEIAMENLARTAGYPDPIRLQWAMERTAVADLADGPITVEANGVEVTLSIDPLGRPDVVAVKNGKKLAAIPAAVKKVEAVAQLAGRKRDLVRQSSRTRKALEEAMCRGDEFEGREIADLFSHAIIAPMIRSLVLVGEGVIGYPVDGGKFLEAHDGTLHRLEPDAKVRIAHPCDLLGGGAWSAWQKDCFLRERIQPFKQVFRELYVPTKADLEEKTLTRRYAGHQVNPRQALGVIGSRGWVHLPDEGLTRTFHALGITARVEFNEYFTTPAEVEGLTLEAVTFTRRGEWKSIPLDEVPARMFSEVMRDVDLMVSVAHAGGVDPEASASTVEMRAELIRQTCGLLKIENVKLSGSHALIAGKLREYSVHLGSAVVHMQPGGHLCIVPVPAQHRGRLFLPFADDDPRTAEAVSKVILLAKDNEIKDPIILEQIMATA